MESPQGVNPPESREARRSSHRPCVSSPATEGVGRSLAQAAGTRLLVSLEARGTEMSGFAMATDGQLGRHRCWRVSGSMARHERPNRFLGRDRCGRRLGILSIDCHSLHNDSGFGTGFGAAGSVPRATPGPLTNDIGSRTGVLPRHTISRNSRAHGAAEDAASEVLRG